MLSRIAGRLAGYYERRADDAHEHFLTAWTGLDMNDWERTENRLRRWSAFWRRHA